MDKIQMIVARIVLALTLVFAAAPLAGCSENNLPTMTIKGGDRPTASDGTNNLSRGLERNGYAAMNRGDFLGMWIVIAGVPWLIFLLISGWLFGKKNEKPLEILTLCVGAAALYKPASHQDLEPWLLLTWVVPCAIYIFLKGEKRKFVAFGAFSVAFAAWSIWMAASAINRSIQLHPVLMMVLSIVLLIVIFVALVKGEDSKPAEEAHGH